MNLMINDRVRLRDSDVVETFTVRYFNLDKTLVSIADSSGNIQTKRADELVLESLATTLSRHVVRVENTGCNEIDPPSTEKENTMSETSPETTVDEDTQTEVEVAPTRLQAFVNNHPRAAKAVAITGGVLAVAGGIQFTRTLRANKDHLTAAGDHVHGALDELSNAASPTDD